MLATAILAALMSPAADPPKDPFEFADGDRVVFLGGTLIEREQKYGYWELALTLANKDKNVTFRNLGWSGDTVWGESRGSFDGPKKGLERTVELVKELKPTVIVICYGHVESFDGKDGVAKFTDGLEKLIEAVNPTKARVVLMTPTPFENVKPITDADTKNANLKLYAAAVKQVADKRKLAFIDLFTRKLDDQDWSRDNCTDNGLHLSKTGYITSAKTLQFHSSAAYSQANQSPLVLQSGEITPELRAWLQYREDLTKAIVAKNELFFHRWRPQNITYLTGFRKHEQGNNAKEIVQFDPLVEKAEQQIAVLRTKVK